MSIQELKLDVEESVFRIAPERAGELRKFFAERQVKFQWSDTRSGVTVDTATARITLPRPFLMLLWAASLQYWVIYSEYVEEQGKTDSFDLAGTTRRCTAQTVFIRALQQFRMQRQFPDEPGIPTPCANPESEDEIVANELFLAAIAWILLHEIGHLRLNHSTVSANAKEEEDLADKEATTWVLQLEKDQLRRRKRIFGICVALLLITALDLNRGEFDNDSHPRAFDRMYACLKTAALPNNDKAFAFCIVMIRTHLATVRLLCPPEEGGTWEDEFNSHLLWLRNLRSS